MTATVTPDAVWTPAPHPVRAPLLYPWLDDEDERWRVLNIQFLRGLAAGMLVGWTGSVSAIAVKLGAAGLAGLGLGGLWP